MIVNRQTPYTCIMSERGWVHVDCNL